jgi:hypothetical protein
MNWRKILLLVAGLMFAAAPRGALAQSGLDPGKLPSSTVFYLAWHGTPAGEARNVNSLLAIWDDPDFAPVRAAMIEEMMSNSASSQKTQATLTRDELAQYASLLDNEIVIGYLPNPNAAKNAELDSSMNKWNGAFLVYDRTGKETTLTKLLVQMRNHEKEPPEISATSIAGIPAIKVQRRTGTSYWAEDGKYAFTASDPAVFEQIGAWTRRTAPADGGLSQTAAYHEASDLLKDGMLEVYFRFPSVKDMNWDSEAGGFHLRPMLRGLKFEAVHSIAGRLTLDGARTRVQGAILGDASPGTLFDIWDAGTDTPASMQFVNANTVSYQTSQINLLGIYELIKRGLRSSAGDGQSNPGDFMEAMAKTRLGMPLPDALGLFSGEFATVQSDAALDPAKQVYMFGIRKKPETLKMLRTGLGDYLAGELVEGDTTFLKISEGGIHSAAGTATWKYQYLAVSPDVIVYASRRETVRELFAARKNSTGAKVGLPQAWQTAREQFPKSLNGMSFMDLQKVDWAAMKEHWIAPSGKTSKTARTAQKPSAGALSIALEQLSPQVFQRHLHLTASGSWKDSQGVHVNGWIE